MQKLDIQVSQDKRLWQGEWRFY